MTMVAMIPSRPPTTMPTMIPAESFPDLISEGDGVGDVFEEVTFSVVDSEDANVVGFEFAAGEVTVCAAVLEIVAVAVA